VPNIPAIKSGEAVWMIDATQLFKQSHKYKRYDIKIFSHLDIFMLSYPVTME